ncbi:MAG: hypothetical protein HQL16_01590 [Candidatus Omnitrophica bacterium]|nr:hypothetical protein [Candidatus Omnitrophota bacterium]
MLWLMIFISVVLTAILGVQVYLVCMVRKARKQYLQELKEHSRPTMWDVRETLLEGDRDLAVQIYCEIFGLEDIEKARKDVEEIERSLKG